MLSSRATSIALCGLALAAMGCHAPVPRFRDAFSAAGSTRIAPPATNSFVAADPYYPGGAGLSPPRASTQPISPIGAGGSTGVAPTGVAATAPSLPPTPPYQPAATATRPAPTNQPLTPISTNGTGGNQNGRFVAPPAMDIGGVAVPAPRVRISRESTTGQSFQPFNDTSTGMVATDLTRSEPAGFNIPGQATQISNLPPAVARNPSPSAIILPGQLGVFPRAGADQWQSRR